MFFLRHVFYSAIKLAQVHFKLALHNFAIVHCSGHCDHLTFVSFAAAGRPSASVVLAIPATPTPTASSTPAPAPPVAPALSARTTAGPPSASVRPST